MQLIKALIIAASFRSLSALASYVNGNAFDLFDPSDELDARDLFDDDDLSVLDARDLDELLEPRRLVRLGAPTPPPGGWRKVLTQNRRDLDDMDQSLFEPRADQNLKFPHMNPKSVNPIAQFVSQHHGGARPAGPPRKKRGIAGCSC